jgi:purine-cytosine permease-like protein
MQRNYTGIAVVILALALGVGWGGTMILVASARTPPISEAQGQLLGAIAGGIIAILAAYMGLSSRGRRRPRDEDEDEDDDEEP